MGDEPSLDLSTLGEEEQRKNGRVSFAFLYTLTSSALDIFVVRELGNSSRRTDGD